MIGPRPRPHPTRRPVARHAAARHGGADPAHALEQLEARQLLAAFSYTAEEVYALELVNRARANPAAEQIRTGINLSSGLTAAEQARLVPQEPLALNQALTEAARAHTADMRARNFFDHSNPDGKDPTDRARAAGYLGTAGENIAAGYGQIDNAFYAWLGSVGHRKNIFSLHSTFDADFHYDEFGVGIGMNIGGTYGSYYTQLFGYQGNGPKKVYILGVVYGDNGNNFYDPGEGRASVRVQVKDASSGATVAQYTTDANGNYQFDVPDGSYNVVFTDLVNGKTYTRAATVSGQNVKVDAKTSQMSLVEPPDEHADSGEWTQATTVAMTGGSGTAGGRIGSFDADLFRFVAAGGPATIRVSVPNGSSLNAKFSLLDAAGNEIATSTDWGPLLRGAQVEQTLAAGQTYFILVEPQVTSTGDYELTIAPADTEPENPESEIDPMYRPDPAKPSATVQIGNKAGVFFLNTYGRPVFAEQTNLRWSHTDLVEASGVSSTAVYDQIIGWYDERDGRLYAFLRGPESSSLLFYDEYWGWWHQDLLLDVKKSQPFVSTVAMTADTEGRVMLTGTNLEGDLVIYEQTGRSRGGYWVWRFQNLTDQSFGGTTPTPASEPVAFTTPNNSRNIAFVDSKGLLYLFYKEAGAKKWGAANMRKAIKIPKLTGNLTINQTADGAIDIVGTAKGKGMSKAVWSASYRWWEGWTRQNLTALTRGPKLTPGSITSYVNAGGVAFIAGLDADGVLQTYRYTPATHTWNAQKIALRKNQIQHPLTGAISATRAGPKGQILIVGVNEKGESVTYFWRRKAGWRTANVSEKLAA